MKVLFVGSGNHGKVSPIIQSQGDSLASNQIEVVYFLIHGKGVKGYLKNVRLLRKYIKNNDFDVIHAHYSLSAFTASLAGAKPLVVSLMGSDVKASSGYKFIIRFFARVFRWKAVIVKSKDMYKDLGMKKVHIIPNGVNMELFGPKEKDACRRELGWSDEHVQVLFPANPSRPEKDYDLARQAVELYGVDSEIHVFEDVSHATTPLYYYAADVVLLTSKWEGSPNVIKEAMACGRPIVCTDMGDVCERLDGVAGCYVAKTREPKELAELLQKALAFEGKTNGREKLLADGLDNRQVAKQMEMIYKNALE